MQMILSTAGIVAFVFYAYTSVKFYRATRNSGLGWVESCITGLTWPRLTEQSLSSLLRFYRQQT